MDNYVEIDVEHLQDELYARKQLCKKQKEELEDKQKVIQYYRKENKNLRRKLRKWEQGKVQYFWNIGWYDIYEDKKK